jgi:uncharacterized coiled-coil DUF342 family protein
MSGSFWAAGKNKVASADSRTPTITEAPPKMAAPTPQKKGLVLKGMTNGHANGHTSKSAATNGNMGDWADEEDDTDFIKTFSAAPDPRIATLEHTIALKEERVKELEATVITKTLRIEELETTVKDNDNRVGELEGDIDEKDSKIDELKKECNAQFLQIQELVVDADERDRRIEILEAEIDEKAAAIRELELKSGTDTPVTTDETSEEEITKESPVETETQQINTAAEKDPEVKIATEAPSSASDSEGIAADEVAEPVKKEAEVPAEKKATELPVVEKTKESPAEAGGPSFGDFPTFITKETMKVVPPAPKPKTLKFPIDMSKFGKQKPASPVATKRSTSPADAKNLPGHTTPWGAASKNARVKSDTMPHFEPHKDIRQMPHGERVVFANGPEIIVKLGETKLATIPKYILMQCSDLALKYFRANPEAKSWVFPAGIMDTEAAKAHLAWMDEMTYQGRVYSITLNVAPANDRKNLHICRAARIMGLNNTYVGHFTKQLCNRIREGSASPEFMDMICALAVPKNDPIFECLANNLVNQKKIGQLENEAVFDKLVAKHANLREKIEVIENKLSGRRGEGSQRGASGTRNGENGRGEGGASNGGKAPGGWRPASAASDGAGFGTTR